MKPTLIAACDVKYFSDHGISFINSCKVNDMDFRIYTFNNFEMQGKIEYQVKLKSLMDEDAAKIIPVDLTNFGNLMVQDVKALYASVRFILLEKYLRAFNSVLIVDIDSVINKPIEIEDEYDIGLFLRENNQVGANEYERLGMMVAAGAVYVKNNDIGQVFSNLVHRNIVSNPIRWFNDQHAIYRAYQSVKDKSKVYTFTQKEMNWEFDDPNALIYTGKGERKFSKVYLDIKEKYNNND